MVEQNKVKEEQAMSTIEQLNKRKRWSLRYEPTGSFALTSCLVASSRRASRVQSSEPTSVYVSRLRLRSASFDFFSSSLRRFSRRSAPAPAHDEVFEPVAADRSDGLPDALIRCLSAMVSEAAIMRRRFFGERCSVVS